jgi:hypothetical protein
MQNATNSELSLALTTNCLNPSGMKCHLAPPRHIDMPADIKVIKIYEHERGSMNNSITAGSIHADMLQ